MIYQRRLQKEMEFAIRNNLWFQRLESLNSEVPQRFKMDIRVAVRLEEDNYGVHNWIGHMMVLTDQVKFTERIIWDYENWQTDAANMGAQIFRNILMRGLFVIEARGQER